MAMNFKRWKRRWAWTGRAGFRILVSALAVALASTVFGGPIRNVILCIGDGMGEGQIEAAHCYVGAPLSFEADASAGQGFFRVITAP